MKRFALLLASFLAVLWPASQSVGLHGDQLRDQMMNDLTVLKQAFSTRYAPASWKRSIIGWDLEKEIQLSLNKIQDHPMMSIKEYQQLVKHLFRSPKDYHVSILFYSTTASMLPFRIQGADNRYFITWVSDDCSIPFKIGDELLSINGKPIKRVVNQFIRSEFGSNPNETDKRLAEIMFTLRIGMLGHKTCKGPVNITWTAKDSGTKCTDTIEWMVIPEQVGTAQTDHANNKILRYMLPEIEEHEENSARRCMLTPIHNVLKKTVTSFPIMPCPLTEEDEEDDMDDDLIDEEPELVPSPLGDKIGFLPNLGPILIEDPFSESFRAYIYETKKGHRIGFVRIPTFLMEDSEAKEFARIIKGFEKSTQALVIDQTNNPGGSLFFTYGIASMFAKAPLKVPRHCETITQKEVLRALMAIQYKNLAALWYGISTLDETVDGYYRDDDFETRLINYCQFIVDQWNAGRSFTELTHVLGIEELPPHPWANYTKPVLVLVNELDFSGGDFFPAILQDNERAKIFGTVTAGAGGFVYSYSHPNLLGIAQYSITGSIASRLDESILEGRGVTPDIEYVITPDDLQNEYRGYVRAVNKAIEQMIEKS